MERLPNDCFSNPAEMLSVAEARRKITQAVQQIATDELVDLHAANNRILAKDIYSTIQVPPSDNSAVDGYAFSHQDYENSPNLEFTTIGVSAAGKPFTDALASGQCIKIFTGGIMPPECDSVAMIEDIQNASGKIRLPAGLKMGANCRLAGEDIKKGSLLLAKGMRLRPQELGFLASIGEKEIPVFSRLKVALVSTGDELVDPGDDLPLGGIYDSNRYILKSMLENYGCEVHDFGVVCDKLESIQDTLVQASKTCDLIVTSGGVSMGDEDHVKSAVEATGNLHFWRIAIKPGRPLALGQVQNTAFVGLPGNPVAAFVCTVQLVRPMIAQLSGQSSYTLPEPLIGKASFSMNKKAGRREWLRGRYHVDKHGSPVVEKYSSQGSGLVSSLVWANGLIELDEDTIGVQEGDPAKFFLFSELFE